jgi:hypothetical protein
MTKPKPKSQHLKTGAPSKYKPEYCAQLIAHMTQGLSFETFAAVIKVNQDTLHEWAKVHPEFSEAKKEAWAQNQLFWERIGITGMAGKIANFNATVWIFNMKNRHRWRDVQPLDSETQEKPFQKVFHDAIAKMKTKK